MYPIPKNIYSFVSDKNKIKGKIFEHDYGALCSFEHNGKTIYKSTLTWQKKYDKEMLIEFGKKVITDYIENGDKDEQTPNCKLHYWTIEHVSKPNYPDYLTANGTVTGHPKLEDSEYIHTSPVLRIEIDEVSQEAVIWTINRVYHCPLEYCDFDKQDEHPEFIPEYDRIKEIYYNKRTDPEIEAGKLLLVISNFDNYYFHSLFYKETEDSAPVSYRSNPHIGTFQDSFLIQSSDWKIDLRYFPHYNNIEFYEEATKDTPWYIENIGSIPLYAKTSKGTLCINPGERKKVSTENAESETPFLPKGDLYPADFD